VEDKVDRKTQKKLRGRGRRGRGRTNIVKENEIDLIEAEDLKDEMESLQLLVIDVELKVTNPQNA